MLKRSTILLISVIVGLIAEAQFPPTAQALFNEAKSQDSIAVLFAQQKGAQIIPTSDGNSFYIQWFPSGMNPAKTPVIVTLHGSNGFAFHEFINWYIKARENNCGIIAIQWYRGKNAKVPDDYFNDSAIYTYIDEALHKINYPSNKAFLHGFSRGSARMYAIVFIDSKQKNYFCSILSNAGSANENYPLYRDITNGKYGKEVFKGKHWNLFCGEKDPEPDQSGCPAMNKTKAWLESQGAIIDNFIQDANGGHNALQLRDADSYENKETILSGYIRLFGS